MSAVIFGDSLAKGMVHQMAREYSDEILKHAVKLQAMDPIRSECRTTRYKRAIKMVRGFFGTGLRRVLETGDGKQKVWTAHAVMTLEHGGLKRCFYKVPFKSPGDFSQEEESITAAPHCVQRLIQIHGAGDPFLVSSLWLVHSAGLDRSLLMGEPNEKGSYITFGPTELVVWRPSGNEDGGWVAVTAIGTDALDGYNQKIHHRLRAGFKDKGILALDEADYGAYLSRTQRMSLAMALLDSDRKGPWPLAA